MQARVARYEVPPERCDEAVEAFLDSAREIAGMNGFGQGYIFIDSETGTAVSLTMWADNAAFESSATKAALARRRAVDMLTQVGIENGARRLRQYPHQMSGGMLQRIMIAAALLTEPRLLLADEPTTALDVTTQAEVMAILDGLRRNFGLAMLFITHDLELAAAICDRTVVMYAGQIVEVRASALLHGDPLHPYTAALAAARPDIGQTADRLRAIPGRPLSAFEAPPAECAFAPRCPHAIDICRAAVPDLVDLDGGTSRCVRARELRGQLQETPDG